MENLPTRLCRHNKSLHSFVPNHPSLVCKKSGQQPTQLHMEFPRIHDFGHSKKRCASLCIASYTFQLPSICLLRTALKKFCSNNGGLLAGTRMQFSTWTRFPNERCRTRTERSVSVGRYQTETRWCSFFVKSHVGALSLEPSDISMLHNSHNRCTLLYHHYSPTHLSTSFTWKPGQGFRPQVQVTCFLAINTPWIHSVFSNPCIWTWKLKRWILWRKLFDSDPKLSRVFWIEALHRSLSVDPAGCMWTWKLKIQVLFLFKSHHHHLLHEFSRYSTLEVSPP